MSEVLRSSLDTDTAELTAKKILMAYFVLALVHATLLVGRFSGLYRLVRVWPTRKTGATSPVDVEDLVSAIDCATMFYFGRPRCLHYAGAVVCLLRLYGIRASLVIGVRQFPFVAHAWVELDGKILVGLNDREGFQVMERL